MSRTTRFLLCLIVGLTSNSAAAKPAQNGPPNIMIVIADDMGYSVGRLCWRIHRRSRINAQRGGNAVGATPEGVAPRPSLQWYYRLFIIGSQGDDLRDPPCFAPIHPKSVSGHAVTHLFQNHLLICHQVAVMANQFHQSTVGGDTHSWGDFSTLRIPSSASSDGVAVRRSMQSKAERSPSARQESRRMRSLRSQSRYARCSHVGFSRVGLGRS